jgi:iron(III) transport system substrate-binding protein
MSRYSANPPFSSFRQWCLIHPFSFILHPFLAFLLLASYFLLPSCSPPASTPTLQLQVISPHGADIRREFASAFSAWHQARFGTPVEVLWPDIGGGGTGNIVRYLNAAFAHRESSGDDVIFGGGTASFDSYIANQFLIPLPPLTAEEIRLARWTTDPLDDVPPAIFNSPLHGKDNRWVAATMSVFGIEINPDRIAELRALDSRLDTPRTWEDIAGPPWFGHLSLADPSKSGSVKTSYEMILQQYGWEKGWPILVRLFANAAMVREIGSYPADDVASAEAVAGICIDFYGRLQTSRVGPRAAAFIVPQGGTALDSDPIALLKGAPHPELAARFIRFVISPEGQRLWVDKVGVPGGPLKTVLGRMSVLPSIYETEGEKLFDPRNPFQAADMLTLARAAAQSRNAWLGDLIKAALIDNHSALVRARRALKSAGDPPALLAEFAALPDFLPASVANSSLNYAEPQPLTTADLPVLARQYSPPKDDPLYPYFEKLQTRQKDAWRASFATRFARLANQKP